MPIDIAPTPKRVSWAGSDGRRRHLQEFEQRAGDALVRAAAFADVAPWVPGQGGENLEGLGAHLDAVVEALLDGMRRVSTGLTAAGAVARCELVVELQRLRQEQQNEVVGQRLRALTAIQDTLGHTQGDVGMTKLLQRAAEEACRICGLDRAMIFRLDGSLLVAEVTYFVGQEAWAADCHSHALEHPIELNSVRLETEMLRRKAAALVTAPMADPRAWHPIVCKVETAGYVVVPIMAGGQIIATLHGDTHFSGRVVDAVDRDSVAAFAIGLGYALERAMLVDRLHAQREAVRRLVHATEATVDEFCATELTLARTAPQHTRPDAHPLGTDSHLRDLLTRREVEVLRHMAAGASNKDIANRLVIAEATVKSHVKQVLRKLRAANRAQAVSMYLSGDRTT
jgi:DNA-binding NarL/FixJ family response regulator